MPLKKISCWFIVVLLALTFVNIGKESSILASSDPIIIDGNDKALPENIKNLEHFKLELNNNKEKSGSYHNGKITINFIDSKTFNWQSNLGIKYVFVKGGKSGNLYQYNQEVTMDNGLHAPKNGGGKQADIGHITFYYEEVPAQIFENPVIGDGADPWIVRHTDGYYYYTNTTGNNITVWKSKTVSGLQNADSKVVWSPDPDSPNDSHIWAPEMHFIEGKWYIYFAASDGDMGKQRMHVIQSETADPLSEYSYPEGTAYGKITTPSDKWAIDGTILQHNGQYYFSWSGWEGDVNVRQDLYIAPMTNPWTVSGERVELSRPEYEWEKIGEPHVNEGPQFLRNPNGQLFLIYSASGSWTDDYKLGLLTLTGSDPLDPNAWEKKPVPIFVKDPAVGVFGPGHNGFFTSPDGTEDWIIYHAAKFEGAGWNRNVRMQKFSWNTDGTPNFGTPVATGAWQAVPSGEQAGSLTPALPVGYKFEAEDATVNRARIVNNTSASNGKKVGYIDFQDSFVEFDVDVPAGDYTLKIRYANGVGRQTSHYVSVNGENTGEVVYNSYGWDTWYFTEKDIKLTQQQNKIRISKGTSFTELDFIELVPKQPEYRYEAELAAHSNVTVKNSLDAGNKQKVTFDQENSAIEYRINIKESGTCRLKVIYQNQANVAATQKIVIDGKQVGELTYSPTSENAWGTVFTTVKLEQGVHTIGLSESSSLLNLDFIQLEK